MKELPRLMTSNENKLREYRRLGIEAIVGGPAPDLPEVSADPEEVALRKAFMAGPGALVEDSSLDVEGESVGVDVRWLMGRLAEFEGRRAVFRVILALNDGERVRLHEGRVEGVLRGADGASGFGFDPFFVPDGSGGLSLARLEELGRKDEFSARARAAKAYAEGTERGSRPLSRFEAWTGPWQGGSGPSP